MMFEEQVFGDSTGLEDQERKRRVGRELGYCDGEEEEEGGEDGIR